jgi:hypothetical protein
MYRIAGATSHPWGLPHPNAKKKKKKKGKGEERKHVTAGDSMWDTTHSQSQEAAGNKLCGRGAGSRSYRYPFRPKVLSRHSGSIFSNLARIFRQIAHGILSLSLHRIRPRRHHACRLRWYEPQMNQSHCGAGLSGKKIPIFRYIAR